MIETKNNLSIPTGPEFQLVVGEGTYVLKEDLHFATPPPHPSKLSILTPNPLATNPQPATAGTKLSLICFESQSPSPSATTTDTSRSMRSGPSLDNIEGNLSESRYSVKNGSGDCQNSEASFTGSVKQEYSACSPPAFGEGNFLLSAASKDSGKKKKPRNNIAKSNSSFISRCMIHENLSRRLEKRQPDGYFAFVNINRAYQWLDLSSPQKTENLTKILFTKEHCLCHDVNQVTKAQTHMDVIMGFSTGEFIWYEPISQKYARLNKNGIINANPVSDIKWIPGSESLFLAAHTDGSLIVYSKEREDATFLPEETKAEMIGIPNDFEANTEPPFYVGKSVHSKNQKYNPVSLWKPTNQRINAFSLSPDGRHLAVVCEGGTLCVIDYLQETLLHRFSSYYGGLMCVCWSPDGRYILTGGQDDLVTIWSFNESRIVARCQGHQSWVTAVCFDSWRCDNFNYRFGSVGEDCRLLLWDFSVSIIQQPKPMVMRLRDGIRPCSQEISKSEKIRNGKGQISTAPVLEHKNNINHPVEPKAATTMILPVMSKVVHENPLSWLGFTEESILTTCRSGHLRVWDRPQHFTRH